MSSADALDRKIIEQLQKDARASYATIGRAVGLTGPGVYARVKRLEESGIIRGYKVDINPDFEGRSLVAFVRIVTRPTPNDTEVFEKFAINEPRIVECYDVNGEDCFYLKVEVGSTEELRALLVDIRAFPEVVRTISSIVLVRVKEAN
ncbi:MAG: Lrp/AsnC family transcriptional regulator [Fimbriimonadaceae bacterium]|nr:Lrp/AsnC family transcriptional regulator [Fimbriimonadaceae bacterium]